MSRSLALGFLAGIVLAAPAPASDRGGTEPVDRRVAALSEELRCPVCQNLSVWDSPSDVAHAMRLRIRELARSGMTDEEIRAYFVARYGEWVLLEPRRKGVSLAVWLAPVALVLGGAALVSVRLVCWRRRARAFERVDEATLAAARARLAALEEGLPPP